MRSRKNLTRSCRCDILAQPRIPPPRRSSDSRTQALRTEYETKKAPLFKQRFNVVQGTPGQPGVPNFWLRAFQNHMMLAEDIQKPDEDVLTHLIDVKYTTNLGPGKAGFQLAFNFAENPYFEDSCLTKVHTPPLARCKFSFHAAHFAPARARYSAVR